MAQSRNTKRTSSARSGSTSKRGGSTGRGRSSASGRGGGRAASRRAQRRAQRASLPVSLALFGAGLLLFIMVLIRGQNLWQTVRSWLFGAGGITVYFIWALLIYAGYLAACGGRVGRFCARMGLLALLMASVPIVFSDFTLHGDESLWEIIKMLFAHGCGHFWSGGVAGGLLGVPLLAFCGRPVANILMVLLFLLGLMVFFAVTPADIVQFLGGQWQAVQARREARLAEENAYDTPLFEEEPVEESLESLTGALPTPPPAPSTAHHRAFDANPYIDSRPAAPAAPAPASPAPPKTAGPRADFDVDLGPDIEDKALQNAVENDPLEPIVIGPGGTFGMDPLGKPQKPAGHKPAAVPAADGEFVQQIPSAEDAPAEEAAADELDELIRKAMDPAPQAAPAVPVPAAPGGEEFDTLLEPPTGEIALPLPPADAVPAAPAGVPTLGGSYDEMRDAWNAGTPLADAMLAGSRYIAPEAVAEALRANGRGAGKGRPGAQHRRRHTLPRPPCGRRQGGSSGRSGADIRRGRQGGG